MTDDTRKDPAPKNATSRDAAKPSEAEPRNKEARRTTAELLARSLQARFAAVARQSVALALAKASADEFTHITTGDYAHGFPEGSDYGALCPQDDLSKQQAEDIFREAGEAVQAEAKHMAQGASPHMAAAVAEQLARWEEGAALEWANMTRIREKLDREDAEDDAEFDDAEFDDAEFKDNVVRPQENEEAAPALSTVPLSTVPAPRLYLGRPLTPGMEYVEDWLGGMGTVDRGKSFPNGEWIAQNIDEGFFVACPRCHFLHPAHPSWVLGRAKDAPERMDACDVCAHVSSAAQFGFYYDDLRRVLSGALAGLSEARWNRAEGLYDLWMGGFGGC